MEYSSDSDTGFEERDLLPGQEKREDVIDRHPRIWACLVVTVLVCLVVAFSVYDWRVILGRRSVPGCRKTRLFPFKVGCPTARLCASLREGIHNDTHFFRTEVVWKFGSLDGLHDHATTTNLTDTHLRKRMDASPRLVRGFVGIEDSLEHTVPSELSSKLQKELHVSLSYFCCLTGDEMKLLRNLTTRWSEKQTNLSVPVKFDHVECRQERINSVTTLLVVDEKSQKALMSLNNHLEDALMAAGVPIVVLRKHQMPFHSTIIGFHTNGKRSISRFLEAISEAVFQIDSGISLNTVINGKPELGPVVQLDNNEFSS